MTIFSLTNITLLTALGLSSIAAWYSILGLTAIFAAATIPIIIMGGILEIAKVVTTIWLHRYWHQIQWTMKLYLVTAVVGLALLTSIGVFGFLSKAHIEQGVPTGDIAAKLALIDEKITTQRENISASRAALAQMDAQVNARLERGSTEQSAERAVQIRRQQQAERNRLLKEINDAQTTITKLNEERAPIAAEYRQVEAKVGPIKYIAALIYEEESNNDTLERAVRWLILLIVLIFDPLALTLVLAASASREWDKMKKTENIVDSTPYIEEPVKAHVEEPVTLAEIKPPKGESDKMEEFDINRHSYLFKPFKHFAYTNNLQVPNPPIEETVVEQPNETPLSQIKQSDVLYTTLPGGYVNFRGKHMSLEALQQMHPELFITPKHTQKDNDGFPKNPNKNLIHIRTDVTPNKVYQFTGDHWVEMDKDNENYIQHLIKKIELGEYDVQLLTADEKDQIAQYLKK